MFNLYIQRNKNDNFAPLHLLRLCLLSRVRFLVTVQLPEELYQDTATYLEHGPAGLLPRAELLRFLNFVVFVSLQYSFVFLRNFFTFWDFPLFLRNVVFICAFAESSFLRFCGHFAFFADILRFGVLQTLSLNAKIPLKFGKPYAIL